MKKLASVILVSICFLFVLSGRVIAGKNEIPTVVGKEVISAENRGIILHHFFNISLEKGDYSKVSLSYEKPENEKLEMMGILAPSGNHILIGFVNKGNPVVIAMRMKNKKIINVFADMVIGKDNKWARTFCSAKCKDGWSDIPVEDYSYSQIRGKEICRAMDCLTKAKDDRFALQKKEKHLEIAYNVKKENGEVMIIFSNKKLP